MARRVFEGRIFRTKHTGLGVGTRVLTASAFYMAN